MLQGKVSVVMPAYNEGANIRLNLRETVDTLSALGYDYDVIVVDDGSSDHMWQTAEQFLQEHDNNVRLLRYEKNEGKGNAVMRGTAQAHGDFIVFLDADMDLHPAQLPTFFEIMEKENADAVIGCKLHPQSRVDYPLVRRIGSIGYYTLVRLLFGLPLRDTQTGLKLFRAEMLHRVFQKVMMKRFATDLEVLAIAHAMGYRICEAPVTLHFQRKLGRLRFRDVVNLFLDTLAIFYRLRILRYYDTVGQQPRAQEQEIEVLVGSKHHEMRG